MAATAVARWAEYVESTREGSTTAPAGSHRDSDEPMSIIGMREVMLNGRYCEGYRIPAGVRYPPAQEAADGMC